MRPFPIFPFLDGIAAAVAAAEAAFANAVARQPPPPPPSRTALPFANPVNAAFVPPIILPPPPQVDTQQTQPILLVSYKTDPQPQVPDGEQIRKDVIAGKSIDQIANDQHTTREQVIATMKAAGMTVETTDPSGKGDARSTSITDPKSGQVVTEHTDFESGNYYITVKGPDGKETSSPVRDGRGWKVTSSRDEKTGAVTTRYEDDLGSGKVTEETRFQDGTVVEKTTPKGGATSTVVTLPGGKKVTLDPKQNPDKDAAAIKADVLAGKSIDQIALERGLTSDQVTAGLAVAGLQVKTEKSGDGYVLTTRLLDRNGKEVAGYTDDYGKGEHTSREIDAKGNAVTTVTNDDGTVKKTVAEPNGRKTETTTETTKDGTQTTTAVTFNGYTLTTKPDGSITLTDNASGNTLNIKPKSVDEALARTLVEVDPNSSDPATAKKAQVAKTVIEGMLAGETLPGLQQNANDRHTDTQNALKQYGPGQVGANATPQNPYGDRPLGKAPSGGDWVPMNGVWMDPKLAQAIAAENTALSKLSEAQAKAKQGQAQYDVYALDPAYKDALDGAKSIIDKDLEPFRLVWNPSKPEGTLAEAQQRLAAANKESTEASQARGEYETAQKLLNDAITKQAKLPPLIDPKQPTVHAVGDPVHPEQDAADAKAAHADVDAMFYGVRLHTSNGDKSLSDYMVDVRQDELNATKDGTPEHTKAEQALNEAKDLQSKAGSQQTAAQAYYNYYTAQADLTQKQAQATGLEQQIYGRWMQENSGLFEKDKEFYTGGGDYRGKLQDVDVYVDPDDHQIHVALQFEHGKEDRQLTGSEKDIGKHNANDPLNKQWQAMVNGADSKQCGLDGLAAAEAGVKSTGANLNKTLADQLQVDIKDLDTKIGQLKSNLDSAIEKHGIGTIAAPPGLLPPGVKPVKVTVDGVTVFVSPDDADDVQKNGLDDLAKRHRPVQIELNGEWRWVDPEVAAAQVALKSTQDQRSPLESERDALVRAQHWNEFQLTQPMALLDDAGATENDARLQATYLAQHRDEALAGYQSQFGKLYAQGFDNQFHQLSGDELDQKVAQGLSLNLATDDGRASLKTVTDAIHELGGDAANVKVVPVFYVDGTIGSQQTGLVAVQTGDGTKYVDVTGHHFDDLEDFRNNNRQFSESGKLVVPVGLEMNKVDGKIALDVVGARHVSTWDKVVDPLIGIGTGIATIASFTPAAPVAAWFAVAGGTYLGAKTGYNEYQYIKHGGDWTDGESLSNLFGVATAVLPVGSGSLRLITLAKNEVPLVTASRIAFGAVRSSTPHLEEAQGLMQASVFGGQGTKLMRTARAMDGTAITVGVPQIGMSLNQLSQFDQMSGLDQTNAIMGLGIGIYGTGMGYLHLRTSQPRPGSETKSETGTRPSDLPPEDGATPRSLSAAYHPAGEPLPGSESPIPPAFRKPKVDLPRDPFATYRPGDPTRPLDSLPATPLSAGPVRQIESETLITSLMDAGVNADTARLIAAKLHEPDTQSLPPVQIRLRNEVEGHVADDDGGANPLLSEEEAAQRNENLASTLDQLPMPHAAVVDGADIPANIAPHELFLRDALFDPRGRSWQEPGWNIVLDIARPDQSDLQFAQGVANASGVHVLVPKTDAPTEWQILAPETLSGHPTGTIEWGEGGDLFLAQPDGSRVPIRPEDHVGRVVGFGGSATAIEIGDKVLVVQQSDGPTGTGGPLAQMLARRDQLLAMGAPYVAKMHGTTKLFDREALLMDRYQLMDRDLEGNLTPPSDLYGGYRVTDTSLLSGKSIESLQAIKKFMLETPTDIDDLQFLIARDGTFYLADFEEIMPGEAPRSVHLQIIDDWIEMAHAKVAADEGNGTGAAGVIRLVDEHGQPFEAQILGRGPVSADKVYIPPEDGSRQTLEDGTPLWAVDDELMSKTHIVAREPETGEIFVLPWIRGAADPGPNGSTSGSGPQPIPVDQLRSMSKDDVGAMSLSDIILFTDDHTATMSNKQWSAFGEQQIAAIPEDAIPGIPPGRLARLRPEQTAAFTDGQLAAMTDAQARKLTLDQFGAFSPTQVGTIMDHHVTVLRPAQIGRLSTEQMAAVTPGHLTQFNENQILGLTSAQLAHLTTKQMATFSPDRIVWLAPEQVAAFTPEQVRGLTAPQVAALKPAQVMRLTGDQLAVLSLDQVRALTRTQISALRSSQVSALSPEQVAAIPADRMSAFSSGQIAALSNEHITALSLEQVRALTGKQISALRPNQVAALSPKQVAAIPADRITAFSSGQIAALSNEQVTALSRDQVHALTTTQISQLRPNQIAALSPEQVAAIAPDRMTAFSDLAVFSTDQLRGFTGEQIANLTEGQIASLSADQRAALEAPRTKGVKKAFTGLITELRQNGLSYLVMGASSAVFGYGTYKLGVLPWFNSTGYLLRGSGFIVQAKWPEKFGPGTKWAPRFAKLYAATFLPNVYSGTTAMFDPVGYTPGVYIPFGIGTLPFAAQQAHYVIKGEPAKAPLGNHLGYAGYTLGSGWYIYDTIWGAEVGSDLGPIVGDLVPPTSAFMFQLGSELWIGSWVASRKANQDTPPPGTSRTRLDDIVDSIVLDRIAPRMEGKVPKMVDRIALGVMYGGGLVLFGAMGFATLFKAMADDNAKKSPGSTPASTQPPQPGQSQPPQNPPVLPPILPPEQPPEPRYVIVGPWHPNGSAADNSTLWDIAGNNLGTLMTPQQKTAAKNGGLSIGDDRDTLVADYGLPVLIDLNPQYPLAQNPDLIQPGWRLKVG